jgi:hypothetical protein
VCLFSVYLTASCNFRRQGQDGPAIRPADSASAARQRRRQGVDVMVISHTAHQTLRSHGRLALHLEAASPGSSGRRHLRNLGDATWPGVGRMMGCQFAALLGLPSSLRRRAAMTSADETGRYRLTHLRRRIR